MSRRLAAVILPLLIGALLLSIAPAAMAGSPTHGGTYGRHYLADGQEYPGVKCRYVGDGNFGGVKVDAPFVYAVSSTAGTDTQQVGWAFRVQSHDPYGGPWTSIFTSSFVRAMATDQAVAAFTARGHNFIGADTSKEYRVVVIMRWYGSSGVTGWARHVVSWYHGGVFEPGIGPDAACPGFIL